MRPTSGCQMKLTGSFDYRLAMRLCSIMSDVLCMLQALVSNVLEVPMYKHKLPLHSELPSDCPGVQSGLVSHLTPVRYSQSASMPLQDTISLCQVRSFIRKHAQKAARSSMTSRRQSAALRCTKPLSPWLRPCCPSVLVADADWDTCWMPPMHAQPVS